MSCEFLIFYVTALAMSATDDAAMIVFVLRIREHFIQPALIAAAPHRGADVPGAISLLRNFRPVTALPAG